MLEKLLLIILVSMNIMPLQAAENSSDCISNSLFFLRSSNSVVNRIGVFVDQQEPVSKDPFALEVGDDDFVVILGDITEKAFIQSAGRR